MRRKHRETLNRRLRGLEESVDALARQVRRIAIAGRYVPRRVDEAAQNGDKP